MSEDYLKEIKENNESFGSNEPFESEKKEPVEADYTVTSDQNISQNNNPDPTPSEEPKEPTNSNEPEKTIPPTKKPRSKKTLFIVLGLILVIILIIIGFNMLQNTDVDLTDQENTNNNLTDVNNTDLEDLSNLAEDQNIDSTENLEDLDTNTGTEDLSELEELLINCEEYTHTREVENFLPWPGALVKVNYEYNIIGLTEDNDCEIEQNIKSLEYMFDKNKIIEYLDNPENKLAIFTNTAFLFGLDSNFPDINNITNFSEIESDVDNLIQKQKEDIITYYDSLSEEDWEGLRMIEEETNTDENSEDYERIICYVSNKEYIPKIFGVSEKNFEEIIANLKANKNIDIYVNPVDKRADYDWGYCIQG